MTFIDGILKGLETLNAWATRTLAPGALPQVETRGYDAPTDSIKTISGAPAVNFLWKEGTVVNAGTAANWIPANTKRAKPLMWWANGTAAALAAFQENTGTIGAPSYTNRMRMRLGGDGPGAIVALPEQFFGPVGDGAGIGARVEILTGTGTFYGGMHGLEA